MALKLTVILGLMIFVAMYFAPVPERALQTARAPQAAPEPVAPEEPEVATAEPAAPEPPAPSAADSAADTAAAVAAALAQVDEPAPEEDPADADAPLNLGTLSLGTDGAAALSLADSVRERAETAREQSGGGLLRPQAELPPLLPDTTANTGATDVEMARITGNAVNLRAGPSTGDAVVGQVGLGDRVEVLEQAGPAWSAIRNPGNGGIAYISSQFLAPVN